MMSKLKYYFTIFLSLFFLNALPVDMMAQSSKNSGFSKLGIRKEQ